MLDVTFVKVVVHHEQKQVDNYLQNDLMKGGQWATKMLSLAIGIANNVTFIILLEEIPAKIVMHPEADSRIKEEEIDRAMGEIGPQAIEKEGLKGREGLKVVDIGTSRIEDQITQVNQGEAIVENITVDIHLVEMDILVDVMIEVLECVPVIGDVQTVALSTLRDEIIAKIVGQKDQNMLKRKVLVDPVIGTVQNVII